MCLQRDHVSGPKLWVALDTVDAQIASCTFLYVDALQATPVASLPSNKIKRNISSSQPSSGSLLAILVRFYVWRVSDVACVSSYLFLGWSPGPKFKTSLRFFVGTLVLRNVGPIGSKLKVFSLTLAVAWWYLVTCLCWCNPFWCWTNTNLWPKGLVLTEGG